MLVLSLIQTGNLLKRWFSNHTGGGQVAVRKMVAFFSILTEADPSKATEPKNKKTLKNSTPSKKTPKKEKIRKTQDAKTDEPKKEQLNKNKNIVPSININLQIHISADASPDQIDKIFENMAKHIYNRDTLNE